jgi:hypothetical protein
MLRSINYDPSTTSAISFRAHITMGIFAVTANALKIADLNVLAAAIAVNGVVKTYALIRSTLRPHEALDFIASGLAGCAVYTFMNNRSANVQMITFLSLLALDMKVAGQDKVLQLLSEG